MYFITTKRMLEVCFSAHPNIQYRTIFLFGRSGPGYASGETGMKLVKDSNRLADSHEYDTQLSY